MEVTQVHDQLWAFIINVESSGYTSVYINL